MAEMSNTFSSYLWMVGIALALAGVQFLCALVWRFEGRHCYPVFSPLALLIPLISTPFRYRLYPIRRWTSSVHQKLVLGGWSWKHYFRHRGSALRYVPLNALAH